MCSDAVTNWRLYICATPLKEGQSAGQLFLQVRGDELPMKPPILNEDLICHRSGDDDPGHVDSRDITFQGRRIAYRPALLRRELDSQAAQEIIIGVIAGKCKNKVVVQVGDAVGRVYHYVIGANFADEAIEVRGDLAILDPVFDVRLDPIFHMMVHVWP